MTRGGGYRGLVRCAVELTWEEQPIVDAGLLLIDRGDYVMHYVCSSANVAGEFVVVSPREALRNSSRVQEAGVSEVSVLSVVAKFPLSSRAYFGGLRRTVYISLQRNWQQGYGYSQDYPNVKSR